MPATSAGMTQKRAADERQGSLFVTRCSHLRPRQASLTIELLHQSFAVSVSALFSGSERRSPQQIDQKKGRAMYYEDKEPGFLDRVWLCLWHYWND
jgi:hypothetical protein